MDTRLIYLLPAVVDVFMNIIDDTCKKKYVGLDVFFHLFSDNICYLRDLPRPRIMEDYVAYGVQYTTIEAARKTQG